jgi:hypothetical protein
LLLRSRRRRCCRGKGASVLMGLCEREAKWELCNGRPQGRKAEEERDSWWLREAKLLAGEKKEKSDEEGGAAAAAKKWRRKWWC